ncbi:MAG TPA: transcriptional repressor [Syntrophales bacterium]|nr:transcriptional repressor [Syntrophales bacterium]HPQ42662.1 transcriptional repressor [Syntrophales bacterium]
MKRKTVQRNAIQETFLTESRPMRVDEILQLGRKTVESLNQATVYRNLKTLVDDGWLKTIHHPKLGVFYERVDKKHHHYFHCHACDRLFDVPGCALHGKEPDLPGFVAERHEVFFFGVCPSCSHS